ncbi:sulfurtransferase-like selenium metabolism protein YedF [Metallumcola ferriviriculae]|uniref:Sulfurtransferase-like selenium metabolism protein YedF n=1 Tax=Metallumcola ferriviriculae TaxID=3039180 RepID=A0AAU0UKE7_9FIRM|nr:sulfurtransferase-like selenium metabolism protein YedF [Desulfitibacteraceae bacterium MK1]
MDNIVDATGLSCPQPVVVTKKALEQLTGGKLVTIVDNEAARDNVVKLAKSLAMDVQVEQQEDRYHVHIYREDIQGLSRSADEKTAVMLFGDNVLGSGERELGEVLIKSYFYTLVENDTKPRVLMFINQGVYLTCESSPVLSHLLALEKAGVEVLSCGTCLDFYQLKEKLCVGTVTNMYTILENLMNAERAITF